MLKQYHVTPSATTETDLIPTVTAGKAVAINDIEITAVTGATVEINIYDGVPAKVHVLPLTVGAGDPYHVEMKRYITAGAKVTVKSNQADTTFSAYGVETANA
jgi:hypothetical protein